MPKPGQSTYYGPNGIDHERSGYKFKPGDLVHLEDQQELADGYDALRVGARRHGRLHSDGDKILSIGRDDILIIVAYAQPGFADGLPAYTCYHAMANECLVWIDDIWFKKYDEDANET